MRTTLRRASRPSLAGSALALSRRSPTAPASARSGSGRRRPAAAWLGRRAHQRAHPSSPGPRRLRRLRPHHRRWVRRLAIGQHAVAGQIRDAVAAPINDYITLTTSRRPPAARYAGPSAKALASLSESGGTPTTFGGVNLVSRLEARVGRRRGRLADVSTFGDFANSHSASRSPPAGSTTAGSPRRLHVRLPAQAAVPDGLLPARSRQADADQSCATATSPDGGRDRPRRADAPGPEVRTGRGRGPRQGARLARLAQAANGSFRQRQHEQHRPGRLGARCPRSYGGRHQGRGWLRGRSCQRRQLRQVRREVGNDRLRPSTPGARRRRRDRRWPA